MDYTRSIARLEVLLDTSSLAVQVQIPVPTQHKQDQTPTV